MTADECRAQWAMWQRDPPLGMRFGVKAKDVAGLLHPKDPGFVYVASPFSRVAVDELGRLNLRRANGYAARAEYVVGELCANGVSGFAPVSHSWRAYERRVDLDPLNHDFWMRWCRPFLYRAAAVWVPRIAGWNESKGIAQEVIDCLLWSKPVLIEASNG